LFPALKMGGPGTNAVGGGFLWSPSWCGAVVMVAGFVGRYKNRQGERLKKKISDGFLAASTALKYRQSSRVEDAANKITNDTKTCPSVPPA
jgi:hypothetical protein